jgi:hypothetical protein
MHKELSREKVLETLGVLALACLVFGHLARHRPHLAQGLFVAAVALLAVGLFVKPVARWIALGWLKLAEVLGAVNSRILLGLIFYVFLTPIAVLARATRGDFLALKRHTAPDRTYWQKRDHAYTAEDLGKLW